MRRLCLLILLCGCSCNDTGDFGRSWLGAPYMSSPLGDVAPPDDGPLIRYDAFDCTTFVETVLADGRLDKLNQIRYKNGQIGFLNRNHFVETDWLPNNSNLLENVSGHYDCAKIRRVYIDKSAWFKTVHNMDVVVPAQWVDLEYVPYECVRDVVIDAPMVVLFIADNPKNRDKIGTDIAVVHMGVVMPNRVLRHASSERGMVVDVDFDEYVTERMKNPNNLGVSLVKIK